MALSFIYFCINTGWRSFYLSVLYSGFGLHSRLGFVEDLWNFYCSQELGVWSLGVLELGAFSWSCYWQVNLSTGSPVNLITQAGRTKLSIIPIFCRDQPRAFRVPIFSFPFRSPSIVFFFVLWKLCKSSNIKAQTKCKKLAHNRHTYDLQVKDCKEEFPAHSSQVCLQMWIYLIKYLCWPTKVKIMWWP